MAVILDFFSTLWSFVWALITNWIIYMTAFPLVLDDLIKWCSPKASAWIENKLSGTRRRRAEIYLMFGGFFVASFMAFDGEHDQLKQVQSDKDSALKQLAALSPSGQLEEIKGLRKDLASEKITFSEIELKQQREIDSVKTSASTLAPRTISDEQRKAFLEATRSASPKCKVAVIVIANGEEVTHFSLQLRQMLDDAGYKDSYNPSVVFNPFDSFQTTKPTSSAVALGPNNNGLSGGEVQNALKAIGIPADGTRDDKNVLGLKSDEIAVLVLGK